MKYAIGFVLGVLVSSVFFMWQNRKPDPPAEISTPPPSDSAQLSEDFQSFYQRFHQDSIFQVEHISFPLEGLPPQADSQLIAQGDFRWQRENWKMQKSFDTSSGAFIRELSAIGDAMVIEQITHKVNQYGIVRRFAKIGGEWQLIYYSAMNKRTEKE